MKRGFTIVELMIGMVIAGFVVMGSLNLFVFGVKGFSRISVDAKVSNTNAQTIRRIAENLKGATSVTVSDSGKRIDYTLPKYSGFIDPTTGEKELFQPLQSDGVARSYVVSFTNGTLTEGATNKVMLKDVAAKDPDSKSTQYGQAYVPFTVTLVGSIQAVSINLIVLDKSIGEQRYSKFKTTVIGHNLK